MTSELYLFGSATRRCIVIRVNIVSLRGDFCGRICYFTKKMIPKYVLKVNVKSLCVRPRTVSVDTNTPHLIFCCQ